MLAQAYVMEDGRRVFKTEDGMQVFDEFGAEVAAGERCEVVGSFRKQNWGSIPDVTGRILASQCPAQGKLGKPYDTIPPPAVLDPWFMR